MGDQNVVTDESFHRWPWIFGYFATKAAASFIYNKILFNFEEREGPLRDREASSAGSILQRLLSKATSVLRITNQACLSTEKSAKSVNKLFTDESQKKTLSVYESVETS